MKISNPYEWSITYKILTLTIVVSAVVWFLINNLQSQQLKKIFMNKAITELKEGAADDRLLFDQYTQSIFRSAKLITGQKQFIDYIETIKPARKNHKVKISHISEPPSWMPRASIMRTFYHARYALLFDHKGLLHSIYHHSSEHKNIEDFPKQLLEPKSILRKLSHNQAYMTMIDHAPYLITSERVNINKGYISLVLVNPIDSQFLTAVTSSQTHHTIIALINKNNKRIIASSNNNEIPLNSLTSELKDKYIMVKKSFFDYGASDLELEFTSFASIADVEKTTEDILRKNNYQQATLVLTMAVTFFLIMLFFLRRIILIRNKINHLSHELLDQSIDEDIKGDEITTLDNHISLFAREIKKLNFKLLKASDHDELTSLYNRRKFNNYIEAEYAHTNRTDSCFTLIMIDIDYFKQYNDHYGHQKGDHSLIAVALAMKASLPRSIDFIARYGGEEFVVVLPATDMDGAFVVAENIRKNVNNLNIEHKYSDIASHITISQGLATHYANDNSSIKDIIETADKYLYSAKLKGRNLIVNE